MIEANYETFERIYKCMKDLDEASHALHKAVSILNIDNYLISVTPQSTTDLLESIIISLWDTSFLDDFYWWMYEAVDKVVWLKDYEVKEGISVDSPREFYEVFTSLREGYECIVGVYWNEAVQKWCAASWKDGGYTKIGYYANKEDAEQAAQAARGIVV